MNTKTIGQLSAAFLTTLHQEGIEFFDTEQAIQLLNNRSDAAVRQLLAGMVQRGLLMRLRDGLFHIIPYDRDPVHYFPDWHVAAHHLAGQTPYYIGYYSALVLHGLTTQPALTEQIVVAKTIRPTQQIVKGIAFQFITHNPPHFFGSQTQWIQGIYKVNCSDLEKTLLDCAYKPDYAGGITEISKALFKAKANLNTDKLLEYATLFGSLAAIRRLGFLLEILDIQLPIMAELQKMVKHSNTYVPLDTALPKEGRSQSRWGIIQNIDISSIQTAIFT